MCLKVQLLASRALPGSSGRDLFPGSFRVLAESRCAYRPEVPGSLLVATWGDGGGVGRGAEAELPGFLWPLQVGPYLSGPATVHGTLPSLGT